MNSLLTDKLTKETIRDQGRRGTCVACAVTAAHELVRADGTELCVEFLNWAAKQRDGLPIGEEGTTLEAAKAALEFDGQPVEDAWPYDEYRDQWNDPYSPPSAAIDDASARKLQDGSWLSPTAEAIRSSIDKGLPVVAGLQLYSTWLSVGADGLIANPTPESQYLGGHAVLVIGYLAGQLLIQNSWGRSWGNNGLGSLTEDYIEQYCSVAWAVGM